MHILLWLMLRIFSARVFQRAFAWLDEKCTSPSLRRARPCTVPSADGALHSRGIKRRDPSLLSRTPASPSADGVLHSRGRPTPASRCPLSASRARSSFLRSTTPPSMGPFTLLREPLLRTLTRTLIRRMLCFPLKDSCFGFRFGFCLGFCSDERSVPLLTGVLD